MPIRVAEPLTRFRELFQSIVAVLIFAGRWRSPLMHMAAKRGTQQDMQIVTTQKKTFSWTLALKRQLTKIFRSQNIIDSKK